MADIRQVTPNFAVAPQIEVEDFATLAALGYRTVIDNRPDGESPDD
jgi:sulfide:quinone oxidoreductase